jgi:hypothetical protein
MVVVVEVTVMVTVMARVVATGVRIVEAEAVDFAQTNTRAWRRTAVIQEGVGGEGRGTKKMRRGMMSWIRQTV